MFWLGKFLGFIFGYMMGGPYGAVFGLVLGQYFDISRKGLGTGPTSTNRTATQAVFFEATFTIMGYIVKADGRVSENEIRVANRIMQNMMLSEAQKQRAIHYFNQGKQANFNLDQVLSLLASACHQQQNLLHLFVEIQVQAAFADNVSLRNKQRILKHICYRLSLNPNDFFQDASYHQEYQQKSNYQYRQQQNSSQPSQLEKSYRILGVNSATNDSDLKKAYRKLMSRNHPDKLVSKGLPEEMMKLATQKTQEIKLAYETICRARGI